MVYVWEGGRRKWRRRQKVGIFQHYIPYASEADHVPNLLSVSFYSLCNSFYHFITLYMTDQCVFLLHLFKGQILLPVSLDSPFNFHRSVYRFRHKSAWARRVPAERYPRGWNLCRAGGLLPGPRFQVRVRVPRDNCRAYGPVCAQQVC
jgi:hypothetical protein